MELDPRRLRARPEQPELELPRPERPERPERPQPPEQPEQQARKVKAIHHHPLPTEWRWLQKLPSNISLRLER